MESSSSCVKPAPTKTSSEGVTSAAAAESEKQDKAALHSPVNAKQIRPVESSQKTIHNTCTVRVVTPELRKTCAQEEDLLPIKGPDSTTPVETSQESPSGKVEICTNKQKTTTCSRKPRARSTAAKTRKARVDDTANGNCSMVGRPKKASKFTEKQFTLKIICDATVVESVSMPKKYLNSPVACSVSAARPAPVRCHLDYKVLLEEYNEWVKKGTCQSVCFGKTLKSAKAAIVDTLATLSECLSDKDDPEVVAEQKEFRKSLRQMRRFEDQEKLSIQQDALEAFERLVNRSQKTSRTRMQKLKTMEAELRAFCDEPFKFSKSNRLSSRHICECFFTSRCPVCSTIDFTPDWVHTGTPKIRRIGLFELELEDEDKHKNDNETVKVSDSNLLLENSSIALSNLLHSLEFIEEDMRKQR